MDAMPVRWSARRRLVRPHLSEGNAEFVDQALGGMLPRDLLGKVLRHFLQDHAAEAPSRRRGNRRAAALLPGEDEGSTIGVPPLRELAERSLTCPLFRVGVARRARKSSPIDGAREDISAIYGL